MTDAGNGTYHVAYKAWEGGEYELQVRVTYLSDAGLTDPVHVGGARRVATDVVYADIHGSPFRVHVSPPATSCAKTGDPRRRRRGQCGGIAALAARGDWVLRTLCLDRPRYQDLAIVTEVSGTHV